MLVPHVSTEGDVTLAVICGVPTCAHPAKKVRNGNNACNLVGLMAGIGLFRGMSMMIVFLGIDLAKNVFALQRMDRAGSAEAGQADRRGHWAQDGRPNSTVPNAMPHGELVSRAG